MKLALLAPTGLPAFAVAALLCACSPTPMVPSEAAYAAALAECTAEADARAADDACQAAVRAKYKAAWADAGVTP